MRHGTARPSMAQHGAAGLGWAGYGVGLYSQEEI